MTSERVAKSNGKGLQLFSTLPLRQMLEKAAENADLSEEMRQEAKLLAQEEKLSWKKLKPIYTASMKARKEESQQLQEMCKGSGIVREPPPQPMKSPELVARLEKLRRMDDDRRYKEMVHDITDHERRAEALRQGGLVTYKNQASYGLHVIVVMAVFYLMGHLIASRISDKAGLKAAGGLIGLVFAMLLESTLLIIRTSEYSKDKKGKKRKTSSTQVGPQTAGPPIPIAANSQSSGAPEPKKDR